ncbi:MAG: methyltransferase domain-containing protein [bacterium]
MKFCLPSSKADYGWVFLLQSYKKYVAKSATVLEIGASNIERTKELASLCCKLIGVEYFSARIPQDFENINYIVGDWQRLSEFTEAESIDVAVAYHVIEHVPDDKRAINELYKVLKVGGMAIIVTPNRKRLIRAMIEIFISERKFPFWEHQREYTEKDLLNLLEDSYFREFQIIPVVFGIQGRPIFWYLESVPKLFRKFANFWEVHLFKM